MKFQRTLKLYKALADETRLRILHILHYGYFHVNELLAITGLGQSRVSRHLKILHEAGALSAQREGKHIYYGLRRDADPLVKDTLKAVFQHNEKLAPDEIAVRQHLEEQRRAGAQFFDQMAEEWDHLREQLLDSDYYLNRLRKLVDRSHQVVELGSGTGSLLLSLAEEEGEYLGVDMAPKMVEQATQKAASLGVGNVKFLRGEIEDLPIEPESASTVIISMVLHYLATPELAIREAARILKPGGIFLVHDFYKHDDESYREIFHHRWLGFEVEDIRTWLDANGFGRPTFVNVSPKGVRRRFLGYAKKEKAVSKGRKKSHRLTRQSG